MLYNLKREERFELCIETICYLLVKGWLPRQRKHQKQRRSEKSIKKHASKVKEPYESTSESSSEEEEGEQGVRRSGRRKRGREVLNYGRLGSPGFVNISSMVLQLV